MNCIQQQFFLTWCNTSPKEIAISKHLCLSGSILLVLNPFLKVSAILAFFKVIHAPKTPERGVNPVPLKWTSYIAIFISSQLGLPMDQGRSILSIFIQNVNLPYKKWLAWFLGFSTFRHFK